MKNSFAKRSAIIPWGLVTSFLCCVPAVAVDWTITSLGTLGGSASEAFAINNRGHSAGWSYVSGDSAYHAFLHDGTIMQDLRTLGGTYSAALAINIRGQTAGYSDLVGDNIQRAFISSGNSLRDVGTLGGWSSWAYGINASGHVVGSSDTSTSASVRHAFVADNTGVYDLGVLGGYSVGDDSQAQAINSSGLIVGSSIAPTQNNNHHAFLYTGGSMLDLTPMSLGSWAFGLNESGLAAGGNLFSIGRNPDGTEAYAMQAVMYGNGATYRLGTLGGSSSVAYGINSRNQIVGWSSTAGDALTHAFLYENGRMRDLSILPEVSAAGWQSLDNASAINDSGQIVGVGVIGGQYRAFRLHPQTTSRYMRTVDPVALFNLGCAQTHQSGLQILHFGRPRFNGTEYGASIFRGTRFTPIADIENAVRFFLNGYYVCGGRGSMTVGVGTSNDGSQTTFAHGQAWGRMIVRLNNYISSPTADLRNRLAVVGASDIEMDYNTPVRSRAWVDGYASTSPVMYYNYGDAAGCPQCNNGWTLEDVWYVSWGNAARPLPVPQIYHTGGAQTRHWQAVTTYGRTTHGTEAFIPAALTQWQACRDPNRNCDPTIRNTPVQAWYQLMNMLHGVVGDPTRVQNILYSSDITWQN